MIAPLSISFTNPKIVHSHVSAQQNELRVTVMGKMYGCFNIAKFQTTAWELFSAGSVADTGIDTGNRANNRWY